MIVFILGGVKGGKSMLAQCIAKNRAQIFTKSKLCYLATMISRDKEDDKRIERHLIDRRDWGFETIEEGVQLSNIQVEQIEDNILLLDSITAFVQNNIFKDDGTTCHVNHTELFEQIKTLSKSAQDIIIVSDYLFSDAIDYGCETELYKQVLGQVHCDIARLSDVVIECTYSIMKFWKNDIDFDFSEVLDQYYQISSHLEYKDI